MIRVNMRMFDNDPDKLVLPEVKDNRSLEDRMGFHPRASSAKPIANVEPVPNMKLTNHEKALRVQARRIALDHAAEMITTLYSEAKTAPNAHDRIDAAAKLLGYALGKPATIVTNEDGSAIVPNFNISFSNQVAAPATPVIEASIDDAAD